MKSKDKEYYSILMFAITISLFGIFLLIQMWVNIDHYYLAKNGSSGAYVMSVGRLVSNCYTPVSEVSYHDIKNSRITHEKGELTPINATRSICKDIGFDSKVLGLTTLIFDNKFDAIWDVVKITSDKSDPKMESFLTLELDKIVYGKRV